MKAAFLNIYRGRYILKSMVIKDIKAKYAVSLLGPFWAVANPLYQIILYTFLFSVILKVRFEEAPGTSSFVVYLLAGLIPWLFFSEGTSRGVATFIENAHIIKKVKFPVEICVASVVVSSSITFFIYLVMYSVMLVYLGLFNISTFPFFIFPFLIQVLLMSGLSFGLGSIAVFFRDIIQIIGMVLNLVFFLTPIVYPSNVIPESVRWLFDINPFFFIVEIYRSLLVQGKMPDPVLLVYPSVCALAVFFAGYFVFSRTKEAFKDVL
ncbi:MAG: ABC transporter permease [Nitrospirota bacterium]